MTDRDVLEKNIERLIHSAGPELHLPDERRNLIFEKLTGAGAAMEASAHRQSIWRRISESGITRLAAAAVITIAVLVGMNQLVGPIGVTSVAFAQVKQAVEKVKWMHVIGRDKNEVSEAWLSFGSQIRAKKDKQGKITYEAYGENKQYVYDPDTATVTISHMPGKMFALGAAGPFELFERLGEQEQNKGAKLTRRIGQYNQTKVEIWEFEKSEQGMIIEAKLFIDIQKHLPAAMEIKGTHNSTVVQDTRIEFKYPANGPEDIYWLGVPESATVVDETFPPGK